MGPPGHHFWCFQSELFKMQIETGSSGLKIFQWIHLAFRVKTKLFSLVCEAIHDLVSEVLLERNET